MFLINAYRYSKALLDSTPGHIELGTGVTMEVEGEIEGAVDHNVDREKVLYLLSLLLRIIECYIKTVPSLATGFELTRLLDEVVPWVSKDSALSASSVISDRIKTITVLLGPVVRTLRQATSARQCKWFGSHDDCVKLVTQLMVAQDWHTAVKRSPLAKLLLLANCERLESADPDLCASVRQLVKLILIQSGMFQGHGEVDMELRTEQAAWLSKLSVCDNSILVLESTLRIAYHWNTELCVESSEKIEKHTKSKGYELQHIEGVVAGKGGSILTAPNSPVMSCAINLCSNSFQTLASHLPKHIRGHLESAPAVAAGSSSSSSSVGPPGLSETTSDATAFLARYSSGFRMELQGFLLQVVMYTGSRARNPRSYGECVLALSNVDSVFSDDVTLVADLTNIDKLLSLSAAAVAQAQPSKRLSKVTKKKEELQSEALRRCSEQLRSVCSSGNTDIVKTFNNVLEKNAQELSSDDTLERTQLRSSIIALTVLNIGKVINSFNAFIEADNAKENSFVHCIDDIGFFTAYICCSTGVGLENDTDDTGLGASFYLWISTLSKREMNKSRKTSMELENKAATIVQCVKLVKALCKKHDSLLHPPSPSSEPVRSPSIGSKRKSISVAVEAQGQGRDLGPSILQAASDLTSLIIELVRQTSCAPLIADALNSADLLEGMLRSDTFGKLTRHMLCASASAYFKRSIHKVKKGSESHGIAAIEHATLPLWLNVAERLLVVSTVSTSRTNSNASALPAAVFQGAEKEIFSLGWMVQHFVADPRLRSQFVDLALKDGQGHLLLDLSLQSAISAHSTFALIPLGAVCVSVLQSASIATLAGALDSFTQSKISNAKDSDSGRDVLEGSDGVQEAAVEGRASTATRNALRCATVSIEQNNHSLPYIKSYVSPLSLMQAVGDSSESPGSSSSAPFLPSPFITSSHSKHCDFSIFSHSLPSSFGRGEMTLWDTVKMLREGDLQSDLSLSHVISNADRLKYLLKIEDYYSAGDIAGVGVISVICELFSHPSIVGRNYTVSLLGAYAQSEMSAKEKKSFLKGPVSAIAVCCSLSDVINTSGEEATSLWCLAYLTYLISLLDDFTTYLSGLGATTHTPQQQSAQLASYFSLLQSMLMIRIKSTAPHHLAITTILKKLTIRAPEISKKLNKWIKSCLKFGLHLAAATDGLTSFYSACRNSTLSSTDVTGSTPVRVGDIFFWSSIFSPKAAVDFYHPSLVLQMIVSHSKFAATLKGSKFMPSNLSLLRLLLVLLSTALPKREVSTSAVTSPLAPLGGRNSVGSGADQFLVGALLQIYQGTICYSDRLIFRILHLLNNADKCPALCTLKPITLNSKKSIRGPESEGPLVGTILQQLVYSTISQYPAWRACAPPPSDLEGSSAEMTYREEYSILKRGVQDDWAGVEPMQADKPNKTGTGSRKNCSVAGKKLIMAADSEGEEEEEGDSDIDEEGEDDSDVDSILSVPMVKDSAANWTCEDSDTYLPSVDVFSGCTDKVYDPSFWLPALHYTLSQKSHSVRQLANTGALSLVIAGVSSRCPVLRAIAVSALQRITELARQQTPDKDAGFRERPQLLLLLNFIRNSIDSSAPSSSGPKQFPSVISLFLSRAALHLLQPTHELFSKINKYLLSRPFVDYKDVPLYDLLIVDGDATTDQAPRLSTFRIVRDGLMTRGDHLNLCRKNIYNRLMLLFPVLTKDVRAGHAVIDLLDKALGIQVCARYLLERCTIISWLQQMASTTNSLDIDTMSAAETVTPCVVDEVQPIDDDDNEFKERDKGTRSTVVRAQPSIQLAAPPRLLTRVLCLLRRALGAGYLLAAGPSGTSEHTDQIVLAIITLIDVSNYTHS
jgi:Nucleolar pre-ribosomal-associated protein 1